MNRVLSSLHAFCFPLPCEKNTNKLLVIQLYCTTSQVSYCYKFPRKKKSRTQGCGDNTALLVFLQKNTAGIDNNNSFFVAVTTEETFCILQ